MSSLNIAIVEDIEQERCKTAAMCREWANQVQISLEISLFESGAAFLSTFFSHKYSIILMDIYMNEINGIETVKQLRAKDPASVVIFLTSSTEHCWEAFPLHVFDYMIKPFDQNSLFKVLSDASLILPDSSHYIDLKVGRQVIRLFLAEISSAVSDIHHTIITTKTGNNLRCYQSFTSIRDYLLTDRRFLLCNRGILVNMEDISMMKKDSVLMKTGRSFPLRRGAGAECSRRYDTYLFERF